MTNSKLAPSLGEDERSVIWHRGGKTPMSERQHCLCSRTAATEALRIIASISWGCVGDGDAGISPSSSQSNGIYVQRRSLQQGNKCLRPAVARRHRSAFPIWAFIFDFSPSSSSFLLRAFLESVERGKRMTAPNPFSLKITPSHCTAGKVAQMS